MSTIRAKPREVLEMARRAGVLRLSDVTARGIHPEYVRRLYQQGQLMRMGRGLYMLADGEVSEHVSLAQASKWVPRGVVCLLSALRFHDIGTQNPSEVWMALDRRTRKPRLDYPPLRVMRFSGRAMAEGIEEHTTDGVPVRIYGPAKTVADCFKYRNKIGVDVAMEALRESRRERKCTVDEIWHYAKICRVATVIMPYLEALS